MMELEIKKSGSSNYSFTMKRIFVFLIEREKANQKNYIVQRCLKKI